MIYVLSISEYVFVIAARLKTDYTECSGMKALSAPFGGIWFIPTGGVNEENIAEYAAAPFVHAIGGSWVCTKKDIDEGSFEKITRLCEQARANARSAMN